MDLTWTALAPAAALLVLLLALAGALQWLRRRHWPRGSAGTELRVLAQLMVGPQQRVVVVELETPDGAVQLTLGVTPQHVRTLHVRPIATVRTAPSSSTQAP
jgi:flagellar protein FliO/FliZ